MAAPLFWGTGGSGGSGIWNSLNVNWWDGSQNVPWTVGEAIFGGTPGSITASVFEVKTSKMTFSTPGYQLSGGWVMSPTDLEIATPASATVTTTLSSLAVNSTLRKTGSAPLTLGSTNFFDRLEIVEGEVKATSSGSVVFSDLVLAESGSATLTLDFSSSVFGLKSIFGGGVIRPRTNSGTFAMTISGGDYSGALRDNTGTSLAITSAANLTLRSAQNFTGATVVSGGILKLTEGGTLSGTASVAVGANATLHLDNQLSVVDDRLPAVPVALNGGGLRLTGKEGTSIVENVGLLTYSRAAKLQVDTPPGSTAELSISNLVRTPRATLELRGTGTIRLGDLPEVVNGILPSYFTYDGDWATRDGNVVQPVSTHTTNIALANASSNVKLSATAGLPGDATWNTVNARTDTVGMELSLDQHTLTLMAGGFMQSGLNEMRVILGTLKPAGTELYLKNPSTLSIQAALADGSGPTSIIKSGSGLLRLQGTNTFTGDLIAHEGTVAVTNSQNLGNGSHVTVGRLLAEGSFTTSKAFHGSTTFSTGVHTVTLTGPVENFSKDGAGTLVLTSPFNGFNAVVGQGTLCTVGGTSSLVLAGGTLDAVGSSGRIQVGGLESRLETGGRDTGSASFTDLSLTNVPLVVGFDMGSAGSDYYAFENVSAGQSRVLFDFYDQGGTATGTNYLLMRLQPLSSPRPPTPVSVSSFSLSADSLSRGWAGTFHISSGALYVTFTSVPEPGSTILLVTGAALFGLRRFRKFQP